MQDRFTIAYGGGRGSGGSLHLGGNSVGGRQLGASGAIAVKGCSPPGSESI